MYNMPCLSIYTDVYTELYHKNPDIFKVPLQELHLKKLTWSVPSRNHIQCPTKKHSLGP